jgi:hypothetical protein
MKSTTEQTDTAPAKAKAGKKASSKKKAPRSARNDAREGSKTATILEMLKRPEGATAKELLKATRSFAARLPFGNGWQENGFDGDVHQGGGRRAQLFAESLRAVVSCCIAPLDFRPATFFVLVDSFCGVSFVVSNPLASALHKAELASDDAVNVNEDNGEVRRDSLRNAMRLLQPLDSGQSQRSDAPRSTLLSLRPALS